MNVFARIKERLFPRKFDILPVPAEESSPELILTKARNLIVEVGWCQGENYKSRYHEGNNTVYAYCMWGAINKASGDDFSLECWDIIREVIEWPSIPRWNDTKGRTKSEVVDAFDKAIARAKSNRNSATAEAGSRTDWWGMVSE